MLKQLWLNFSVVKILKSAIFSKDVYAAAHSALEDDNNLISLVTSLFI